MPIVSPTFPKRKYPRRTYSPGSLSKYGNIAATAHGISFSSQAERDCYEILLLMEKAGEIKDIQVQDHVYLTEARICSIPDFKYFNLKTNEHEWAEFKGYETDVWRIKRRLWKHYGPGVLKVYKKKYRGIYLDETIIPQTQIKLPIPK